jgi:hypothetical protein
MKTGTAKVVCKCANEFQDKKYGKGVRVANTTAKQDNTRVTVRCTVCLTEHQVTISEIKH